MCATLSRGPNVPQRVTRGRVRPPITKRMWQSPASAPPFPSLTRAVLSTKTKQCRPSVPSDLRRAPADEELLPVIGQPASLGYR